MIRLVLASLLITAIAFISLVRADDPDDKAKPKAKSSEAQKEEEALEQERLLKQFRDFETALLSLAQRLERSSKAEDRERAANLRQAIKKAGQANVDTKFDALVALLRENKPISLTEVRDAMDRSKMLAEDINAILALLLNDNRDAQLKAEKERIGKILEMLKKAIRDEQVARAQTESGAIDKKSLAKSQEKVTKDTQEIAKAMGGDPKKNDSKNGDGKSKDGDSKGKGKDGQESKKGDSKDSKNGGDKQQKQETPGKPEIDKAIEKQKRAEEDIQKDKKNDASNNQDEAIRKMEEARKKLEEILRQLREEEMERLLAALQARCERMLAMQIEVYQGTMRVDKAIEQNPDKKASRTEEQRSLQLSDREQEIVRQANSAIQLLQSEGSGVAFPEVFTQVRDDMQHVARRLGKADVGRVTQGIEEDIIATLKEMIDALKKAQSSKSGSGKPGQPGQPQNQNLIDLLSELKMIRSLQIRVNSRTQTYGHQYTGEQANDPDIRKELTNLAQRQQKIFEVTNNIARGKNR